MIHSFISISLDFTPLYFILFYSVSVHYISHITHYTTPAASLIPHSNNAYYRVFTFTYVFIIIIFNTSHHRLTYHSSEFTFGFFHPTFLSKKGITAGISEKSNLDVRVQRFFWHINKLYFLLQKIHIILLKIVTIYFYTN